MDHRVSSSSTRYVNVDGAKLRRVRELLRLTQQETAARAGYTPRLIRKLESGGSVGRQTLENVVTAYREEQQRVGGVELPTILRAVDFVVCDVQDAVERIVISRFDRIFNQRDLKAVDDLVQPEVILLAEGQQIFGREPVRARVKSILDGFNPLQLSFDRLIVDAQTAIVYWNVEATHTGLFFGIEPTGRNIAIRGTTMAVISESLISEARDHWDAKELIDQIT